MRTDETVSAVAMIEALDTRIFAIQPGHHADRTSFLRVQRLMRERNSGYEYLEIGSDIGASLLPHLLDPNCGAMVSIDARPERQPDERGVDFHYEGNSTARMLDELAKYVSPRRLRQLSTIDADASAIASFDAKIRPNLVLIDGEHTNVAAFSDFMAVWPMIAKDAVITFHDANLIGDALQNIECLLVQRRIRHTMVVLPSCVAVFGFGQFAGEVDIALEPHAEAKEAYFAAARRERHGAIANAMIDRTPGLRGRDIAELARWTESVEARLAVAEVRSEPPSDPALAENAEIVRLRLEVDRLEEQAAALTSSTCWKITAPIRTAARLLKGRA
jgi:hypothetical protein